MRVFLVEIEIGELLDSERVEAGEEEEEGGDDDRDADIQRDLLMISRSNWYVLPPPLKHEDIAAAGEVKNGPKVQWQFKLRTESSNSCLL